MNIFWLEGIYVAVAIFKISAAEILNFRPIRERGTFLRSEGVGQAGHSDQNHHTYNIFKILKYLNMSCRHCRCCSNILPSCLTVHCSCCKDCSDNYGPNIKTVFYFSGGIVQEETICTRCCRKWLRIRINSDLQYKYMERNFLY